MSDNASFKDVFFQFSLETPSKTFSLILKKLQQLTNNDKYMQQTILFQRVLLQNWIEFN